MKASELIDFKKGNMFLYGVYKWDVIESIPEFAKLKECKQNPKWHGEGNAWEHTRLVCEAAEKTAWVLSKEEAKVFLTAALFHDIGKGTTTFFKQKDQNWHSYGHEVESERITREMLADEDPAFVEAVCRLVRWHMAPLDIKKSSHKIEKIVDLAEKVSTANTVLDYFSTYNSSLFLLILLKKCDVIGSEQQNLDGKESDLDWLNKLLMTTKLLNINRYYPLELSDLVNFLDNA